MTSAATTTPTERPQKLLTFASGGWVIAVTALICVTLILWAVIPAVIRNANRPPGDGLTIESYGFDLSSLTVDRALLATPILHRDMITPIDDPMILSLANVDDLRKFLVSTDRIIGVTINGTSRAYPITVLNVHEIIHDTLGGVPIAVTYHWPSDSIQVFDRRLDGRTLEFGLTGLIYNSNMVMYERSAEGTGNEALWSQILARPISGPLSSSSSELTSIPCTVTGWKLWTEAHPETTVVGRESRHADRRYKKAEPSPYFRNRKILYPVVTEPPAGGPHAFDRVVSVTLGGTPHCYSVPAIGDIVDGNGHWTDTVGAIELAFSYDLATKTVEVACEADADLHIDHAIWFAWHAMHPDQSVWNGPTSGKTGDDTIPQ